ncbi:MAG: S9 family peptidase [Gammaproteobacteria bacterium]|nr:S9 family peptidase [Gammaproteobacteria bacterium]
MTRHTAPFGTWVSPITSDLIVSETIAIGSIALDGDDIYWVEARPIEGGRNVIVRRTADGQLTDVTPSSFNARTRVHEYGGGAFAIADGVVFFSNDKDQRIYRQDPDRTPAPITPTGPLRYTDGVIDRRRGRLICVREDHGNDGEPCNTLVAVPLTGVDSGQVLVTGSDFYSSPRLHPDGHSLAWLSWNHPNMPWDGTELWVASLDGQSGLGEPTCVAGGVDESIFQPEWSPDGALYFVSDRSGWWNLYRWRDGKAEALLLKQAEFGLPQWGFGMSTYGFAADHQIACTYSSDGDSKLVTIDTMSGESAEIETPYTSISGLRVSPKHAVFIAASPTETAAVVSLDLTTHRTEMLRRTSRLTIDKRFVSRPQAITFPTAQDEVAHAFFYPPCNPDYTAPASDRPPLIVNCHGGPTGATSSELRLKTQFWTSRGFALVNVNYRGSSGYGRAYRESLNGQWGIADVADCVNAARHLIEQGRVDPAKIAISGGSAGGYTVLCALTFHDVFKAGASHYGISDLEALAKDTHKFESRYLDRLVGPYPQQRDTYRERSPIRFPDRLSCPVIFFQGLEDAVVPPNQAEQMVQALVSKGLPVAYVPFAGEQHGFRRAENIKRAMDAELYFYGRVFGFEPADSIEPVEIENL